MVILGLTACAESRRDPCQLLAVEDVKSVDNTVAISLWAGRDGERKDDEVCMFHTNDGDPRVMLFVWYDKDKTPEELLANGATGTGTVVVDLSETGSNAAATFSNDELKLLAVKSVRGVVGIRVRKPVTKDSPELSKVVQLAEKALSRN